MAGVVLVALAFATGTAEASKPEVATGAAETVGKTTAVLNATVNPKGLGTSCNFEWGTTTSYGEVSGCEPLLEALLVEEAISVKAPLSGLKPNHAYHFRVSASNLEGTSVGSDEAFTTLAEAPSVAHEEASSITTSSAVLEAGVNPKGVALEECKFEYGTALPYTKEAPCKTPLPSGETEAPVESEAITGLLPNTTYHFHLVVKSSGGTTEASDATFATLPNKPEVTTEKADLVSRTSARLNALVNPKGAGTKCKLEWGPTSTYGKTASCEPSLESSTAEEPTSVNATISGLTPNVTYHYRVVASNAGGESKGSDEQLTTVAEAPGIVSESAGSVTTSSAVLEAHIEPNGVQVEECRFEYGTSSSYGSEAGCKAPLPSGEGEATVATPAITGLLANKTYHYRLVVKSSGGTTNGADHTFKTAAEAPGIVSESAGSITTSSAVLEAHIEPNGVQVEECRFEYGTSSSYGSEAACKAPLPSGEGEAAVTTPAITGLLPNKTYHFRLVIKSPGGSTNGADHTFKTLPDKPEVTTEKADLISKTTARLNATVNPKGAGTKCTLEWGPTTAYGKTASCEPSLEASTSEAPVPVKATITGLTAHTTYHFRVVASNAGGEAKGSDEQLTTLPEAPAVNEESASSITLTSAVMKAKVSPKGVSVEECHFEYGTSVVYSKEAACKTPLPSGEAEATVSTDAIEGLAINTTYHYRVVAANAGGATNGPDHTFKTLALGPEPEREKADQITKTSARLNGLVNPKGVSTKCTFEWGETTAFGSTVPCEPSLESSVSETPVFVQAPITGLKPNTTYYFRVSASSSGGENKSAEEHFATLAEAPLILEEEAEPEATSAELEARVNPEGVPLEECVFEYGIKAIGEKTAECPHPFPTGTTTTVKLEVTSLKPNTSYHYRLVVKNNGGRTEGAEETFKTLPGAPEAVALSATAVTPTSAVLNASVNAGGASIEQCFFKYGPTTGYGSQIACAGPLPNSEGEAPVASEPIAGLSPKTTYHFVILVKTRGGHVESHDQTFMTNPVAPEVATGGASVITQTSATLSGTVNFSGNGITGCRMEYGPSTAYGSLAPCPSQEGAGANPNAVSAAATGLHSNTTYHYRVAATNVTGTSFGEDHQFQTLPSPPSVSGEAASAITAQQATLSGIVNANGGTLKSCVIQYGTGAAYGSSAPCGAGRAGSPAGSVAVTVALNPNTTYHFRIVATNAGGTGTGPDGSFATKLATVPASLRWSFGVARRFTIVEALVADSMPVGGYVEVLCSGHGCPFKRVRSATVEAARHCTPKSHCPHRHGQGPTVKLTPLFGQRHLPVGMRITVRVRKAGELGKYFQFVLRAASAPKLREACLAPSGTTPGVGC